MSTPALRDRYVGALLGLACGDAVGTAVEFKARGTFPRVVDMTGGGPFGLKPGQWTDDTSMALCLGESLATRGEFDPRDQMTRYLNWWQRGYPSSTGECFDIGRTIRGALARFQGSGDPYSGSTDPHSAGNGSLMRLAPVVLFAFPDVRAVLDFAAASSRTTHAAPEAIESCQLLAAILYEVLSDVTRDRVFSRLRYEPTQARLRALATGSLVAKHVDDVRGSGYCVASLEAALWCFFNTRDFESAVLTAANLGDDADTTAAIVGQVAGAYYGASAIPRRWRTVLTMAEEIEDLAVKLYLRAQPSLAADSPPAARR